MDAVQKFRPCSKQKIKYRELSTDDKQKLLKDKDKKNTQAATDRAIMNLSEYLRQKTLPEVDAIMPDQLGEVLYDYYCAVQPQRGDDDQYCVQTLKCLRAALNRFFRKERGFDIVKDSEFIRSNEMFKAMCVDAKKNGKGVKKSYPPISQIDLERIAEYFCHDHMNQPNPRKLQQNLIFYIVYFFCWRGRENLYQMKQNTFQIIVQPDGVEYVVQHVDEMDKNHGPDDTNMTNEGRMYATNGKNPFIIVIFVRLDLKECNFVHQV